MSIDLRKEISNDDLDLVLNLIKNTNKEIIQEKLEKKIQEKLEKEIKRNKFEKDIEFLKPLLVICDNFFTDYDTFKDIFANRPSFNIILNKEKEGISTDNIYTIKYYPNNEYLCFGYNSTCGRDRSYSELFNINTNNTIKDEFIQSFIKKMLLILRNYEPDSEYFKKILNYM